VRWADRVFPPSIFEKKYPKQNKDWAFVHMAFLLQLANDFVEDSAVWIALPASNSLSLFFY